MYEHDSRIVMTLDAGGTREGNTDAAKAAFAEFGKTNARTYGRTAEK